MLQVYNKWTCILIYTVEIKGKYTKCKVYHMFIILIWYEDEEKDTAPSLQVYSQVLMLRISSVLNLSWRKDFRPQALL